MTAAQKSQARGIILKGTIICTCAGVVIGGPIGGYIGHTIGMTIGGVVIGGIFGGVSHEILKQKSR